MLALVSSLYVKQSLGRNAILAVSVRPAGLGSSMQGLCLAPAGVRSSVSVGFRFRAHCAFTAVSHYLRGRSLPTPETGDATRRRPLEEAKYTTGEICGYRTVTPVQMFPTKITFRIGKDEQDIYGRTCIALRLYRVALPHIARNGSFCRAPFTQGYIFDQLPSAFPCEAAECSPSIMQKRRGLRDSWDHVITSRKDGYWFVISRSV